MVSGWALGIGNWALGIGHRELKLLSSALAKRVRQDMHLARSIQDRKMLALPPSPHPPIPPSPHLPIPPSPHPPISPSPHLPITNSPLPIPKPQLFRVNSSTRGKC